MRQQFARPSAALAMLLELERALHQVARLTEEGVYLALVGHRLAVAAEELGLIVEGVEVADAAHAKDLYNPLRLRREVRAGRLPDLRCRLIVQQAGQRNRAEPTARVPQKVAA